ncbi:MAG: ABC transporter ATP-binding protein [Opitutae bacterium]|nr:ABC transporter ATP-binding protein [Opitutae bacterium]
MLEASKRLLRLKSKKRTEVKKQSEGQSYRNFHALKDISFDLNKGESLGIIGLNGSGKSTLLQIIAGTLQASEGEVEVAGRVAALLELGSGFSPEFTGKENVYLNASLLGLSKRETEAKYQQIVDFADIGEFIDQPVKTYSSGMIVRLAFAVIAHVDADILLIDEALAVGDARFTQKCMRFLRKFREENAILFVTHDLAAMQNLCDRCLCLNEGKKIAIGNPKEVTEMYWETLYDNGQANPLSTDAVSGSGDNQAKKPMPGDSPVGLEAGFTFNSNTASFGNGKARVTNLELLDAENREPMRAIKGGENVSLRISAAIMESFNEPIIGFMFRNRHGQELFSENTYRWYQNKPCEALQNKKLVAEFRFRMPMLPKGHYSITVSVAEGTQEFHEQHHWIHDAMSVESINPTHSGLVGAPMDGVTLRSV